MYVCKYTLRLALRQVKKTHKKFERLRRVNVLTAGSHYSLALSSPIDCWDVRNMPIILCRVNFFISEKPRAQRRFIKTVK